MKCIGYVRVSGINQVNGDGISRQIDTIKEYCERHNLELVEIYRDEGVSGTKLHREGLSEIYNQDIKTIIIEGIDRLGRDLLVSESIINTLKEKGFTLISVREGRKLLDENHSRVMVRQIISSVSQYEKSQIVERLRISRERHKEKFGKCEGRKSILETNPETYKEIKRLRRKRKGRKQRSYETISQIMNENGYTTPTRKPFTGKNVERILNTKYITNNTLT